MINEYDNLIRLLKIALEFYADKNNYLDNPDNPSNIVFDDFGSQARFATQKIEEFYQNIKTIEEEFQAYYINDKNEEVDINEIFDDLLKLEKK